MRDERQIAARLSHEQFACLVSQHQHCLHAFLAGVLGQTEGAFDLVQDTFYEAWQAAQKGMPPFVPGTAERDVQRWLFRAGYNNAISVLRRQRLIRWEPLDKGGEPPALLADVIPFDDRLVEHDALAAALATLSHEDVACLLLRIVHGFSAAETGVILKLSATNVNTRLARAKYRLRTAYFRQNQQSEESSS